MIKCTKHKHDTEKDMKPSWQVVSSAFHASLFHPWMGTVHLEAASHSDQFHKAGREREKEKEKKVIRWLTIRNKQVKWIFKREKRK